ncbi:MAG: hypothetical protein RBR59_08160 [Sulfurimonadaceae bacterium]|jgi:tRNA A37 threonylcarbamoyladenosine synthetase subunit TsaC/SUA5/YrdC|nr:hypothetical protein [Sulfurimonadaceae bacterium]
MDKCSSASRLPSVSRDVILAQTDTTVGFFSQNPSKLLEIKKRELTKPFLKLYCDFKTFLADNKRVPHAMKNKVRRAKKTTFIVKNQAFRIAPHQLSSSFLRQCKWGYSTSANLTGKSYERAFAEIHSDIIIEDSRGLSENASSTLIKLSNTKQKRLR